MVICGWLGTDKMLRLFARPCYQDSSEPFRRSAGFTLLEVLVSMAILAICLTIIMELFSGGLKSARLSERYVRAAFLAREKMEEILLAKRLSEGIMEGVYGEGFRWRVAIHPAEAVEENQPKLPFETFDIHVRVTWKEGGLHKSFEIETLQIATQEETDQTGEHDGG